MKSPGVESVTRSSNFQLGSLADPAAFTTEVQLSDIPRDTCLAHLRAMLMIRSVEEVIAELVVAGKVKCPCHLGIGQEAIAVGLSAFLGAQDKVFGAHRSHSHYLALGGGVYELFAEVLGRLDGCSKGMGGSMHLIAEEKGFMGSVPIVGATIPIAVGAGLALKMDSSSGVAVSYFGDGASEEGVFHESLNLARMLQSRTLFVCENNLYASHLDIKLRQPSDSIARFAAANCVPYETVDGNDLAEMRRASKKLVEAVRSGAGPALLEAVTYRWRGHVGPREDLDVGVRRSEVDLAAWKNRDPISRFKSGMISQGWLNDAGFSALRDEVESFVRGEAARAERAPYPPLSQLYGVVYAA